MYHDCVVIPWDGKKGRRGGWGLPKTDSAYTHAFLNGDPIYLSITAEKEEIDQAAVVCESAERLALIPMVKHGFVTSDRRTQQTVFADGTTVTVNFDTEEIEIQEFTETKRI